jgi:hypothetical protein
MITTVRNRALGVVSAACLAIGGVSAVGGTSAVAADTSPAIDVVTTFEQAPASTGAMFRWWWPSGNVEVSELKDQLRAVAAAGYKGVEIADVMDGTPASFDPAVNGWGGEEWLTAVRSVAGEAKRLGLQVDLTLGARWPAAIPGLNVNGSTASQELVSAHQVVTGGSTFDGPVPAPAAKTYDDRTVVDGKIVTTVKKITPRLVASTAVRCVADCSGATPQLDLDSSIDLTDAMVDGELTWTAPADGTWALVGYWSRGTAQRNDAPYGTTAAVLTAPESRVIDYFSKAGTNAFIDWFDSTLDDETKSLIADTGGAIFEDSLELVHAAAWTPAFFEAFRDRRGYDITRYLPVLAAQTPPSKFVPAPKIFAFTGDDVASAKRIERDVAETLDELWLENHAAPMRKYAKSLGLEYRTQPYGENFDLARTAASVDVIECETLACGTEDWRAMSSGNAARGGTIISDELLPLGFGNTYGTYQSDIVKVANEQYSLGANQMMLHGLPYTKAPPATDGTDPNTAAAWPGFHAFGPGIGEAMGPRQPSWIDQTVYGNYFSRTQHILQTGEQRTDIAVYTELLNHLGKGVDVAALAKAGYSYGYVSPGLLDHDAMQVDGGRLDPDGSRFKALVLVDQATMPLRTAQKLTEYADAGLPVVFVGDVPEQVPGFAADPASADAKDRQLRQAVDVLLAKPSVTTVGSLAEAQSVLTARQVTPDATTGGALQVQHRQTSDADLYYAYNVAAQATTQEVTLTGAAGHVPYVMDAWTGDVEAVPVYERSGDTYSVSVDLEGKGAVIVALAPADWTGTQVPTTHVVSTDADRAQWDGSRLVVEDATAGTYRTVLSDGRTIESVVAGADAQDVTGWSFSLEEWLPGATATQTVKETRAIGETALVPWRDMPGLADSVGIGTYSADVTIPAAAVGRPQVLDLGTVNGSVSVTVNGRSAGPIDQVDPVVEIGDLLQPGDNTVTVRVASNLLNRMRVVNPAGFASRAAQAYGLLGPVSLTAGSPTSTSTVPAPGDTVTSVKLGRTTFPYGSSTRAGVTVRNAQGAAVSGQVKVVAGGQATIATLSNGAVSVKLPQGITPGKRRVVVTYLGSAGSRASTATATYVVTKAKPSIRLSLKDSTIDASQRASARVTVRIPGSALAATGKVRILDGTKVVATRSLRASDRGQVTIRVPRLAGGKHRLSARIDGSALLRSRTSVAKVLRVAR